VNEYMLLTMRLMLVNNVHDVARGVYSVTAHGIFASADGRRRRDGKRERPAWMIAGCLLGREHLPVLTGDKGARLLADSR
jgi:hypothetical protein